MSGRGSLVNPMVEAVILRSVATKNLYSDICHLAAGDVDYRQTNRQRGDKNAQTST